MNTDNVIPEKLKRSFLPESFKVETWDKLEIFYHQLLHREFINLQSYEQWIKDWSELETIIGEDIAWRYINMTRFLDNPSYEQSFNYFIQEISPFIEKYSDQIKKKFVTSVYFSQLDSYKYRILIREITKDLELFREKNIAIQTQLTSKEQDYNKIVGQMTILFDSKELTIQQAGVYLKSNNRLIREQIFRLIVERRLQDAFKIETLFDELIALRKQLAINAGFSNYRDYKLRSMGRFDYTVSDCFDFHKAIITAVVPILKRIDKDRKKALNLIELTPWDLEVDPEQKAPLHPFEGEDELIAKTIECFSAVKPYYGKCIEAMQKLGRLDLGSRKSKAPGGYNYPLNETGVPFIFMNAAGLHRDVVTMVHEGGHALHAFYTNHLELEAFKKYPSEVAELASMTMELISMEKWECFFPDADDLRRAKKEHLEKIIHILPWIALIDKFQHWVYEHDNQSIEDRADAWVKFSKEFSSGEVNYEGFEIFRRHNWHSQMHIFEVPFYYIEYGIAQLGAIAIWRNYKNNPTKALEQYEQALKLGYTKSIPEIYQTAGITFNFSVEYIQQLMQFLQTELDNLS